jgi:hypothetical protein
MLIRLADFFFYSSLFTADEANEWLESYLLPYSSSFVATTNVV